MSAAEGWGGDRYLYLKNQEYDGLMVLRSDWDDAAEAREFYDEYVKYKNLKDPASRVSEDTTADSAWWQTANQSLYLGKSSDGVLIIIAPDEAIAKQVLAGFPGFPG